MAFTYQGFASLGVNLNRQKYGPLDISQVFLNMNDVKYYISKGTFTNGVSEYWFTDEDTYVVPYPYNGQLISIIDATGKPELYILEEIAKTPVREEIGGTFVDYDKYFNLVKAGKSYTAGDNITITEEGVISAASKSYTAGENITITEDGVISAAGKVYEGDGKTVTVNDGKFTLVGYDKVIADHPDSFEGYHPQLNSEGVLEWIPSVSSEMTDKEVAENIGKLNTNVSDLAKTDKVLSANIDTVSSIATANEAAISTLRTNVDAVSNTATANATAISTINNQLATKASSDSLTAAVERITTLETSVSNVNETLTNHGESIATVTGSINTITDRISNISDQVNTKVSQDDFNDLTDLVDNKAATSDVNALTTRVGTAEGKITALESGAKTLTGRVDKLETDASELAGRVTEAEGKITALDSGATALTGRVTTAEGNINNLRTDVDKKAEAGDLAALATRVGTAEGNINNLRTDVDKKAEAGDLAALATRVGTAEGNISNLRTDVDKKADETTVTALSDRIDAIQSAGVNYKVVKSLPDVGEKGIIYLIAKEGEEDNTYIEYIYIAPATEGEDGKFERIGTTAADLGNYVTIDTFNKLEGRVVTTENEIDSISADLIDVEKTVVGHTTSITELNTAVANKADKTTVEGLDGRVTTAEGKINTVSSGLIDVTTNVTTNATNITNLNNTKADKTAVNELSNKVGTLETGATALSSRVTATEGEIDTVSSAVYLESNLIITEPIGKITSDKIKGFYEVPNTAGMTVADALLSLLYQVQEPEITNPYVTFNITSIGYSPSVTNGANTVEIGTQITGFTYTTKYNDGSYPYGYQNSDGSKVTGNASAGTSATACNITNSKYSSLTSTVSSGTLTFTEDQYITVDSESTKTYMTVSSEVTHSASNRQPLTNIATPSSKQPIAEGTITIAKNLSVTGQYWNYYRISSELSAATAVIDSEFIRASSCNKKSGFTNIAIPAGTKRVMFAFPGTKTLKSIIDVDGMGLDIQGNFTREIIQVAGANKYNTHTYTVFHTENLAGLAKSKYTVILA